MPERKEMKMDQQFRQWQRNKRNYLSATQCARYDCVHDDGGAGDGMEKDIGASDASAITDAAVDEQEHDGYYDVVKTNFPRFYMETEKPGQRYLTNNKSTF